MVAYVIELMDEALGGRGKVFVPWRAEPLPGPPSLGTLRFAPATRRFFAKRSQKCTV
jgi:hypothetical protein